MDFGRLLLSNETLLHNCISALSDVFVHHAPHSISDSYPYASRVAQKHTRMLDGLALLMIYRAQNDVCAVSLWHGKQNDITIMWAKNDSNRPTVGESQYLTTLLAMISQQAEPLQILHLVTIQCAEKVVARCRSASRQFQYSTVQGSTTCQGMDEILSLETSQEEAADLKLILVDAGQIDEDDTLQGLITWFLNRLRDVKKTDTTGEGSLFHLVVLADLLTAHLTPERCSRIFNPIQVRSLHKVRAYLKVIDDALDDCRRTKIMTLRAEQILPPPQRQLTVYTRTEDAVNSLIPYLPTSQPKLSFEQIRNQYRSASKGSGTPLETHQITGSQHCELTLALYLLKRKTRHGIARSSSIGCSKAMCHWCHLYVDELNRLYPDRRTVLSRTHGKQVKGWLPPAQVDAPRDSVLKNIGASVEEILGNVWSAQNSVFASLGSGSPDADLEDPNELDDYWKDLMRDVPRLGP